MNLDKHNPNRKNKAREIKRAEELGHIDNFADFFKQKNKDEDITPEAEKSEKNEQKQQKIDKKNKEDIRQKNIEENIKKNEELKKFKKNNSKNTTLNNKSVNLQSKKTKDNEENIYQIRKKMHKLLDESADIYSEFEDLDKNKWRENEEWDRKIEEARILDQKESQEKRKLREKEIISEIQIVKEKLNKSKEEELNRKLEPFFDRMNTYSFLDKKFTNQEGEREFIANEDYIKNDYVKSIYFLGSYLPKKDLWEIARRPKNEKMEEQINREYYTFTNEDLAGEFGDKILKIKKRNSEKNLIEENITLRDFVELGQKRIMQAIKSEDQSLKYMERNGINKVSKKIGKTIYHNFPKIKIGKKETVNQIPFDMSYIVARGYYGADSFATFDKENGKISLVSSPEITNEIYEEIKEIIPEFPAPIGSKLLTPDDPEIIKQIREKISEEKWQEILGIASGNKTAEKTIIKPAPEVENKTARINTNEGAEDEESLIKTDREIKLNRIAKIDIENAKLEQQIKETEQALQEIFRKIEEIKKIEEDRKKELNNPYSQIKSQEEKDREYSRISGNYPKIRELIVKFINLRRKIDLDERLLSDIPEEESTKRIIEYYEIKRHLEELDGAPDVEEISRKIFGSKKHRHDEVEKELLEEYSEENRYENKINAKYDKKLLDLKKNFN